MTRAKNRRFESNLSKITRLVAAIKSLRFALFICVTYSTHRSLFNPCPPSVAHMHLWTGSALIQVKACRLFGAKTLLEPLPTYCQLRPWEQTSVKCLSEFQCFSSNKMRLKISQRNCTRGVLLIYLTSRLIEYVWYVMQTKWWWPYLGHRANTQCNRVWHNSLPLMLPAAGCAIFYSHPHQPRNANKHDWHFPFVTDRIDRMRSVWILSADTTQCPWRSC